MVAAKRAEVRERSGREGTQMRRRGIRSGDSLSGGGGSLRPSDCSDFEGVGGRPGPVGGVTGAATIRVAGARAGSLDSGKGGRGDRI
jgi:hypothetical protein